MFKAATLPYLGHKRRVVELVFAAISEIIPRDSWSDVSFHDPMCGSAVVPLTAKAAGFKTTAGDISPIGMLGASALVGNSQECASDSSIAQLASAAKGQFWIECALSSIPDSGKKLSDVLRLVATKVFLSRQPFGRSSSRQLSKANSEANLAVSAVVERPPSYDSFRRASHKINKGIFVGRGSELRGDYRITIPIVGSDVLYLDPPYPGTSGYTGPYRYLNSILDPEYVESSNISCPSIGELLEAARNTPVLVISYGATRTLLSELLETVSKTRVIRFYDEFNIAYMPALSRKKSKEALIVATLD